METAVVTGASSGLGKAVTLELARRRFEVIAAGRSRSRRMPVVDQVLTLVRHGRRGLG